MLETLNAVAPDPILGIIAAHAADTNPKKIDLGIGVYKNEQGDTPILECVKKAERILVDTESSKTYLGPPGVAGFNSAMTDLILAPRAPWCRKTAYGPSRHRAAPAACAWART